MKPSDAAEEIFSLLEEGTALGARAPSPALKEFLVSLAERSVSESLTGTPNKPSKAHTKRRQRPGADMSGTIEMLAKRLRDAFASDSQFEEVLADESTQQLTKPNVVLLYQRTFDSSRVLPKTMTKPELFNQFRRERINRVRGQA